MSATPPLLFGRYRLLEKLGDGRLASVYGAFDERLHRQVLLHVFRKELNGQPQLRQRFLAEINANAQISHSALLEVFDSGEINERPFMVTEYVAGQMLYGSGALVPAHAAVCMRQIASAVAVCQLRGLPHPPISSRNVLLIDGDRVELVESWQTSAPEAALDLAFYRAPEVSAGAPPIPSSAVYSLGLLLYEMLTGHRPIRGSTISEIATAHEQLRLPALSDSNPLLCLPTLDDLLWQATQRDPQRRIRDVASFADRLEAAWHTYTSDTQRLATVGRQAAPVPRYPAHRPPARSAIASPTPPRLPRNAYGSRTTPPAAIPPLLGWSLLILLLTLAAMGSYAGASYLANRYFALNLPTLALPGVPQVSLPTFDLDVPNWLDLPSTGDYLTVRINANEGLNLRDTPGLASNVITTVPNGVRVEQIGGPEVVDNVSWVYVRVQQPNGAALEGWMSLNFLEQE